MAAVSPIEWTERTWNPVVGCAIHSPGCTHCYAMAQAARLERMGVAHYAGLTRPTKAGPVWTGAFRAAPDHVLTEPLRRRKPTTWFTNSMSDLFGEGVPDALIDKVFAVMALCPQHTFQVLTKRSRRMQAYVIARMERPAERLNAALLGASFLDRAFARPGRDVEWPLPNVWLGVSAEDQDRADERIPDLLETPAAIRFVSLEPLLGPIDLTDLRGKPHPVHADTTYMVDACAGELGVAHHPQGLPTQYVMAEKTSRLDWVIVGGESGRDPRPMHPDWARDLRDQCVANGVPFFFKQWGGWTPGENLGPQTRTQTGARIFDGRWVFEEFTPRVSEEMHTDDEPDVWRVGKKAAGRLLDGRTWDQRPEVRS